MKKLKYIELPEMVKKVVSDECFLDGYLSNNDTVVLWMSIDGIENQREIEFSVGSSKFLTREDRLKLLPQPTIEKYGDIGVNVLVDYFLEEESDVTYESFKVYQLFSDFLIGQESQVFYSRFKRSALDVARIALENYQFEEDYKSWGDEEKISYWTSYLYRMRRQVGEGGYEENFAFDKNLANHLMKREPGFSRIAERVIEQLAFMEQLDKESLLFAFLAGTGIQAG